MTSKGSELTLADLPAPPSQTTGGFSGISTPAQVQEAYDSGRLSSQQMLTILADMQRRGMTQPAAPAQPTPTALSVADLPAPPPAAPAQAGNAPAAMPGHAEAWAKAAARARSLLAGGEDIVSGPAVALTEALPQSVVSRGNELNNWLAQKTGLFPTLPAGGLPQLQAQREQQLAQARQAAGLQGQDWSRLAGQALPWVVAPEFRGLELGGRMLYGAGTGAIQGLEQPAPDLSSHLKNALVGAGVGAALPGAGRAGAALARGVQAPAVRMLSKAGVTMTPGQLFGGGLRALEERLSGFPLVGDVIKSAENRGINQFNHATANQVLAPLGKTVPKDLKPGYDTLNHVHDVIDQGYESLKPKLKGSLDKRLVADLKNLRQVGQVLPPAQRDQLDQFLKQDIVDRFNQHTLQATGPMLKDIETKLGQEARAYLRAQDPDQKKLGAILQQAQLSLRRMLERENPAYRGELQKLNAAYARYLRLQGATGRTAGEDEAAGAFTPGQLRASIRGLDETARKSSFHQGKALMQPWAEAGYRTLARKVPDSGTAGRAVLGALALGAPAAWHPMLGLGAAALPFYTPAGQRLLQKLAVHEAGPVSNALANVFLRAQAPALAGAAVPLLTSQGQ